MDTQVQKHGVFKAGKHFWAGKRLKKRVHTHVLYSQKVPAWVAQMIQVYSYTVIAYMHWWNTFSETEHKSLLYVCCRDGTQRHNMLPRATEQKRKFIRGSRKLQNSYCVARMHVKHYTNPPKVEHTSPHTQIMQLGSKNVNICHCHSLYAGRSRRNSQVVWHLKE